MGVDYKFVKKIQHLGVWSKAWIIAASKISFGDIYNIDIFNDDEYDSDVIITCQTCRLIHVLPAYMHLYNISGCPKCTPYIEGAKADCWVNFAIKAHRKWHGIHLYLDTIYSGNRELCEIYCLTHDDYVFVQPNGHLCWVKHNGCPTCGKLIRNNKLSAMALSTANGKEKFIKLARAIHGDRYDYSLVIYVNNMIHVTIICHKHNHIFRQYPKFHTMYKQKCRFCAYDERSPWLWDKEKFIKVAYAKYGTKLFDYKETVCLGNNATTIKCLLHNINFTQTPKDHLKGKSGCEKCKIYGASLISKSWLNFIAFKYGETASIQSKFSTGKEYRIPGTRYHVDGLITFSNKPDKIVLEFHGNYWHGDPTYYASNWIIKGTRTFGKAFEETAEKRCIIETMGYKYVCIWELEWRRLIHVVKKLQAIFRIKRLVKIDSSIENKRECYDEMRKIYHKKFLKPLQLENNAKYHAIKHFNSVKIKDELLINVLDSLTNEQSNMLASDIPGDVLEPL